jgi:putative membrane protein
MGLLAQGLVALVALLHAYFLVLEMFLWDKPVGLRAFGLTPEKAALTKSLAMNQGLYNGFLPRGSPGASRSAPRGSPSRCSSSAA